MSFRIEVKGDGYSREFFITIDSFPHCCGARVVHGLNRDKHGDPKTHQEIADKLTGAFLAKTASQIPEGVKITRREFTTSGYRSVPDTNNFLDRTKVAKFVVADAVWGEDEDEDEFSLYKWAMLGGDAWQKGDEAKNPNSSNNICVFELNKDWSNDE